MFYTHYPAKFSANAEANVEAEKVKARRRFDQAKKALSANRWGSAPEVEALLKQYIISAVAVFAHEACELGRASAWGVVEMHSEVLDFLHRFRTEAYAERGYDTNGVSLREHGLKDSDFTACPEWEGYEDARLEVAEAQGVAISKNESHTERRIRAQQQIETQNRLARAATPIEWPTTTSIETPSAGAIRGTKRPSFPHRASWLKERLAERAWNRNQPRKFGGPDPKTLDKILAGEEVREDVLEKLATALSKKRGKVDITTIPSD